MKISELKEPIKSWAEENVRLQPKYAGKFIAENSKEVLLYAFDWSDTKEGYSFWRDVNDGVIISHLIDNYPNLPWNEEPQSENTEIDSGFPFKVGDCVTLEDWGEGHQERITAIGNSLFFAVNLEGEEDCHYKDDHWELYTPEKEKDLAGLKAWVVIKKSGVALLRFDKEKPDFVGSETKVLSIEEAKERGFEPLKLL